MTASAFLLLLAAGETLTQLRQDSSFLQDREGPDPAGEQAAGEQSAGEQSAGEQSAAPEPVPETEAPSTEAPADENSLEPVHVDGAPPDPQEPGATADDTKTPEEIAAAKAERQAEEAATEERAAHPKNANTDAAHEFDQAAKGEYDTSAPTDANGAATPPAASPEQANWVDESRDTILDKASGALEPTEVQERLDGAWANQVSEGNSTRGENGEWNGLASTKLDAATMGDGQEFAQDQAIAHDEIIGNLTQNLGARDMEEETGYYIDGPEVGGQSSKHFLKKKEVFAAFNWMWQTVSAERGRMLAEFAGLDQKPWQLASLARAFTTAQRDITERFDDNLNLMHDSSQKAASDVDEYVSHVTHKTDPDNPDFNFWNYTKDAVLLGQLSDKIQTFNSTSVHALTELHGFLLKWKNAGQNVYETQGLQLKDWVGAASVELKGWNQKTVEEMSYELSTIKDTMGHSYTGLTKDINDMVVFLSSTNAAWQKSVIKQATAMSTNEQSLKNEIKQAGKMLTELTESIDRNVHLYNKKVGTIERLFGKSVEKEEITSDRAIKMELIKRQGEGSEIKNKATARINAAVAKFQKNCFNILQDTRSYVDQIIDPVKTQSDLNQKFSVLRSKFTDMVAAIEAFGTNDDAGRLADKLAASHAALNVALDHATVNVAEEKATLLSMMNDEKSYAEAKLRETDIGMEHDILRWKQSLLDGPLNEIRLGAVQLKDAHDLADFQALTGAGGALAQIGQRTVADAGVGSTDVLAPLQMERQRLAATQQQAAELVDRAVEQNSEELHEAAKQLGRRTGQLPASLAQMVPEGAAGPDALLEAAAKVKAALPKDLQDWSAGMSVRLGHIVDSLHEAGPDLHSMASMRTSGVKAMLPLLPRIQPSPRIATVFDKLKAAADLAGNMPNVNKKASAEWAAGLKKRMNAALVQSDVALQQFVARGLGAPDITSQIGQASKWLEGARTTQQQADLQGDIAGKVADTVAPVASAAQRVAVDAAGRMETQSELFDHTQQALDTLSASERQMRADASQAHATVALAVGAMAERVEGDLQRSREADLTAVKKPLTQQMDALAQMNSYAGLVVPDGPQQQIDAASRQLEQLKTELDAARGQAQVFGEERRRLLEQHKAAPRYVDASVHDEYGRMTVKVPGRAPLITASLGAMDDAVDLLQTKLQALPDHLEQLIPTRAQIDQMMPKVAWPDVESALDAFDDVAQLRPGDALVNAAALDERRVDDLEVRMGQLLGPASPAATDLREEAGAALGADTAGALAQVQQVGAANDRALAAQAAALRAASAKQLDAVAAGAGNVEAAALPQWHARAAAMRAKMGMLEKEEDAMAAAQTDLQGADSQLEADDEAWHEKIAKVLDAREAPHAAPSLLEQLQQRSSSRAAQDAQREQHVQQLESKMRALHT